MAASDFQNPPQHQVRQPGIEKEMVPKPQAMFENYKPADKLIGKTAIITGGDSGIGRAVAILYAMEGANIIISYLDEHDDAEETHQMVSRYTPDCKLVAGDIGKEEICSQVAEKALETFGKIDIVINNAAEQHIASEINDITSEQLERTFRTNIFSYFYLIKAALPHLQQGGTIINTTSVVAYKGKPNLIDYAATKGAIVSLTYSLAQALVSKGIRVNAVAPGPIWTPLIPASFTEEQVAEFGSQTPMHRPGQPAEIAPCYVFLASEESSYMSGQVLHPNGGVVIGG